MERCLDAVEEVLVECTQVSSVNFRQLDRIVLLLTSVCAQLALTSQTQAVNDSDQASFSQLHIYLCELCLEYETKLLYMPTSRGRPRKLLNLAFVSALASCLIVL